MTNTHHRAALHLYACGGAAINIAKGLYQPDANGPKDPGFARVQTTFIDTSVSNLPKNVKEGFYHVSGMSNEDIDGSGGIRATNYKAASQAAPEILHSYKPAELNIVLHSASGGSGSMLGPVLVSQLLAQDRNVIVIMVGSTASEKEISNTIETILSYQGISAKRETPVCAIYLENGKNTMLENDTFARINVLLMAVLWSGENHGLDSADLRNFLHYDKVSAFPVGLTGLTTTTGGTLPPVQKGQAISSMISLIREGEEPKPNVIVPYHSFGVISDAANDAIKMPTPIHVQTIQGMFTPVVNELREKLEEVKKHYAVNPIHTLSMDGAGMLDDGMVL